MTAHDTLSAPRRGGRIVMLLALLACNPLEAVPVVEGPHCAPDALGYVVDVLDGDTLEVVVASNPDADGYGEAHIVPESITVDTGAGSAPEEDDLITVRMLGVDAPEIAHSESEVADCYGDESHDFLSDALLGETVLLSFDAECTDQYDRSLAYVLLTHDDNYWAFDCDDAGACNVTYDLDLSVTVDVLFNDISIRYGYARVYDDFDNIRLADLLYDAEAAAQDGNRGLWAECE